MLDLLSTFPNLEAINVENNPVKTKNLNNLTSEQFAKLVQGIKDKKFRVVSWQGTILMDLLEYAKNLVARGNTNQQTQAIQPITLYERIIFDLSAKGKGKFLRYELKIIYYD
ncbi:hypothetical protein [endosymbiont GvMRE of Glomus versiforme]|uniref:hypothetical protein n=1 Tax=endosymbiont GvMRE of Glomus versiforme TaxID=2039283 RepID=UPI0011C4A7BA|nr:hypothetical protein [endosymbiont GvMRE of Glomus versiforme]